MKPLFILLPLVFGCSVSWSATRQEVTIPSKAMNKEMKANVILPDSYQDSSGKVPSALKRYPVVYLLHGHGDDQTGWPTRTSLEELADQHQLIFVCPNGQTAWYFDSFVEPKVKMETHISKEVVPYVDKHFRTLASPRGRAVTGNSMGGHGALYVGSRHPELFGAIGSLSGGVDLSPFPNNWNIKNNLGVYEENKGRWEKLSAVNFLPKVKKGAFRIIISCGSEDVFTQVNRNLDEALTKAGITHEFLMTPGGHNWPYWKAALVPQVEFFVKFFQSSGALKGQKAPSSVGGAVRKS